MQAEAALEHCRGFVKPIELEAVEIPQVLVGVDAGDLLLRVLLQRCAAGRGNGGGGGGNELSAIPDWFVVG